MNDLDMEATDSKTTSSPLKRSHLGLDERRSVPSRIWTTFVLLLMAVLIELPKLALSQRVYIDNRWLSIIAKLVLETAELFVATAIIFVWYRPDWLRRVYLKAEQKFSWVFYGICMFILATIIYAALRSFFAYSFFGHH